MDKINEQFDRMAKLTFGPSARITGSMGTKTAPGRLEIVVAGKAIGIFGTFETALGDAQRRLSGTSAA